MFIYALLVPSPRHTIIGAWNDVRSSVQGTKVLVPYIECYLVKSRITNPQLHVRTNMCYSPYRQGVHLLLRNAFIHCVEL